MRLFRKPESVRGVVAPRRRFTAWAALYFAMFFCLPLFAILAALDAILYFVFRDLFNSCYALFCLLE